MGVGEATELFKAHKIKGNKAILLVGKLSKEEA